MEKTEYKVLGTNQTFKTKEEAIRFVEMKKIPYSSVFEIRPQEQTQKMFHKDC